jgi:hypothetical protein
MASTTRNHHRAHSNSHPPLHVIGEHVPTFGEYHAGQEDQAKEQEREKERERQREKEVEETKGKNRVLGVLMSRLGNSKTFGENVIFMLNRCRKSSPAGSSRLFFPRLTDGARMVICRKHPG